ncbi:MAG TPA: hypothetical protein VGM60_00135 [Pseudonocardia sp.]|uniref:hypothetical protein n=1 Tax=Pseudonocardia sp. TaxID=60912 RepID=UPI002F3E25D8
MFELQGEAAAPAEGVAHGSVPTAPCRVYPLLGRRAGWTVSEHPSGMIIWHGPAGRHYLQRPPAGPRPVGGGVCDYPAPAS